MLRGGHFASSPQEQTGVVVHVLSTASLYWISYERRRGDHMLRLWLDGICAESNHQANTVATARGQLALAAKRFCSRH